MLSLLCSASEFSSLYFFVFCSLFFLLCCAEFWKHHTNIFAVCWLSVAANDAAWQRIRAAAKYVMEKWMRNRKEKENEQKKYKINALQNGMKSMFISPFVGIGANINGWEHQWIERCVWGVRWNADGASLEEHVIWNTSNVFICTVLCDAEFFLFFIFHTYKTHKQQLVIEINTIWCRLCFSMPSFSAILIWKELFVYFWRWMCSPVAISREIEWMVGSLLRVFLFLFPFLISISSRE